MEDPHPNAKTIYAYSFKEALKVYTEATGSKNI